MAGTAGTDRRAPLARGMRRLHALDRRRDRRPLLWIGLLTLALIGVRAASMIVVSQPGYLDAYYYASVAERVARGQGLTADFVWLFLEAPQFAPLPVPSHRFWMPLATLVQAAGIAVAGGQLGDFRAAQLAVVAVAALIPIVTYLAARSLGAPGGWALVGAAVAGLGGALAPAWVSLDAFGIAAVLGTAFFLAFAAAARGSVRAGLAAGALVGLLYLARSEGALFVLPLLWLASRRRTARAGVAGSLVALAFGMAWLARNALLGFPGDLLARAILLVRYEDLFALAPPTLDRFIGALPEVLAAKGNALVTHAVTGAMELLIVGAVPLVIAARRLWRRAEVRAFALLVLVVYAAESLVFTLHSLHGSWFHASASFFPFAVALAAAGSAELFGDASRGSGRAVAAASVLAFGIVSAFALGQWDVDFNTPYRARAAIVPQLPPGPLVVTDAAAWHWITGRQTIVAPADGPASAACVAVIYLATTLVLEPAHFSRYDELYVSRRSDEVTWRFGEDAIRVYSFRPDLRCITARGE